MAIAREKAIKKLNRKKKNALIDKFNPEWKEVATTNGIIKPYVTWSDQVKQVFDEITQKIKQP